MQQTTRAHRESEETFRVSIREVVSPLFRRSRILLLTFLAFLTLTALVAFLVPAPYKAHMAVLVKRDRLDPLVSTEATTQVITGSPSVTEEETNSEVELLQSHDVLEKVVLASGLDKSHNDTWVSRAMGGIGGLLQPNQTDADRLENAVRKLAKKLKVETGTTKSNLIDVTYKSPDPHLSYAVMHALANFYMDKHVEVHRPLGSADFFSGEADKYKRALDASEQRLRDFSRDQGLSAPDVERTDLAQQVANAIGQLQQAGQLAAADQAHIHNDEAQLRSTPERSPTIQQLGPADKLLEDLTEQFVAAKAKRAQLAVKYDAQYPLVREADDEVAQIQAAIDAGEKTKYLTATTDKDPTYEEIRQDLAKTKADAASQRASIAALKSGIKDMQTQMVALDAKALQQQDLLRDVKVNEDNYLLYQSKWQQQQTSDALDRTRISNVAIADPPEVPALPVYSITTLLLAGFAVSVFLSVIAAYVADYLDASFHTPAQVIDILDIPVVVAVPKRA
jgi:uncharacterized protein involved in exopolysaccharide biosynthesis